MENYTPHHNNYAILREQHEEQSTEQTPPAQEETALENEAEAELVEEQIDQDDPALGEAAVEDTREGDPEETNDLGPERRDVHYGEMRYVQGDGDYVSETTAALKNTFMINSDYYAYQQANATETRNAEQAGVEEHLTETRQGEPVERDPEVSELAASYAEAHPEFAGTEEELYEAAYFAKSVEDSEKYPPHNEEMRSRVEDRQASEDIANNLRETSGGEELGESEAEQEEQELAELYDRMEAQMSHQHSMAM